MVEMQAIPEEIKNPPCLQSAARSVKSNLKPQPKSKLDPATMMSHPTYQK